MLRIIFQSLSGNYLVRLKRSRLLFLMVAVGLSSPVFAVQSFGSAASRPVDSPRHLRHYVVPSLSNWSHLPMVAQQRYNELLRKSFGMEVILSDNSAYRTTALSRPQSFDAMTRAGEIDLPSLVAHWKQYYEDTYELLGRRIEPYLTAWERVEREKKLPVGLLSSIAIVETSGIPFHTDGSVRKSARGAAGSFQLMPETAKKYGLNISDGVDERRDPLKSAYAAAEVLIDNYQIYGDWDLAIAGYNSGRVLLFFQEYRQSLLSKALDNPQSLKRYTALEGDSLFLISKRIGASFYAIKTLNDDNRVLKAGKAILIPPALNVTLDKLVDWSNRHYKNYPESTSEYINYTAKVLALMTIKHSAFQHLEPQLTLR
ncbi:MAG: lytic transglycosylase [Sedimenticola sp.]